MEVMKSFLFTLVLLATSAHGHNGEIHAEDGAAKTPASTSPRLATASDAVELVAVPEESGLRIYLDRSDSNTPITDARLSVQQGNQTVEAQRQEDGSYRVAAPWLTTAGNHDLVFSVESAAINDLLLGSLTIPSAGDETLARQFGGAAIVPTLLLVAWVLYLVARRRRPTRRIVLIASGLWTALFIVGAGKGVLAASGVSALLGDSAGEKHHGGAPAAADVRPKQMADHSVFVPKASQRLLQIRTETAQATTTRASRILNGIVINDPNTGATVQVAQEGRLAAPAGGFPRLGQRVRKGELLAYLTPSLSVVEVSSQQASLAAVERDLYLKKNEIERLKEQMSMASKDNNVLLDIRYSELRGLQEQQKALASSLEGKVPLVAPQAGVIGTSSAVNGLTVKPGQTVFEIIDPDHLWIEAISYEAALVDEKAQATVSLPGGAVPVAYMGRGYRLVNQGVPLLFKVTGDASGLTVGQLVDVSVSTRETLHGVTLPRESLAKDARGETFVWVKQAPETFVPHTVVTRRVDDQHEVAVEGLRPGARVVRAGAALLAQIK